MTDPLIECVPNFSEGRDLAVMKRITDAIESVDGVTLLDVDPGAATNRTVVTFVGPPEPVLEAAVQAARRAKELIDLRKHHGEHPRFGAMDVCPLVPVANIAMDALVPYARRLGQRLGDEVGISGYFYEFAATRPGRRNLAACRAGEYEGLPEKLKDPAWQPDFGPGVFDPRYGVTAVGAREFLVAYNVNLNTTSVRRANAIAFDVREKGRPKRAGDALTGPFVRDANGETVWIPGSLKCVKGIGWFIEEYGVAQISMNLTNLRVTPVHVAFEECKRKAEQRGVRVTGSEIVGLVPLEALLAAGRYFLRMQQRSLGVSDREVIKIAVKSLGLDDLRPFRPQERIIEYALAAKQRDARAPDQSRDRQGAVDLVDQSRDRQRAVDLVDQSRDRQGTVDLFDQSRDRQGATASLARMRLDDFVWETASESKAPGGGSISAAMGAFGAALATMVANLSSHKRGWDDRWEEFSDWAERGKACHDELLRLVDADTDAFNQIVAAWGLPDGTEAEKAAKRAAIQQATQGAIRTPLRVMEVALESMQVAKAMAETGLPASASDAGVAALAARCAVTGAFLNVRINAKDVDDKAWIADVLKRGEAMQARASELEREILALVERKL